MTADYPLRFEPVFRRYLWGGRRLGTVLHKPIGEGDDYAESWELVDHGEDQSVVAAGPLAGATLHQLVTEHGQELLGRHHPQKRFPLLMKFLDANRVLSVQVHPDDAMGATLDPPDLGKTEAWVILAADPGSVIYAGLKPGCDRAQLAAAVERGETADCLHRIEPRAGECIFLPAGVVHALGEGLLVAEIQQASDTTFRLFDWNRVGADGKPRELHVEQALEAIDYDFGPVAPQAPQPTEHTHIERLVECEKFVLERWHVGESHMVGGDGRAYIVSTIAGSVDLAGDLTHEPLSLGQTALLPAAAGGVRISPHEPSTLMVMYLP